MGNPVQKSYETGHWLKRSDNVRHPAQYGQASRREQAREELLAEWVGDEHRPGVFAKLRPQPVPMEHLVNSLISSIDVKELSLLEKIKADWEALAGVDNARHCVPVSIQGNCLNIDVENSTWKFVLDSGPLRVIQERVHKISEGTLVRLRTMVSGAFGKKI